MPQFILLCRDKPGALDLRMATRPAHLDYLKINAEMVLLAGPTLGGDGKPDGSMILIEAADASAAKTFADGDPYAEIGLFTEVKITPYRLTLGALAPTHQD